MLDKVLKFAGFDLEARIAALKAEVEQRISEAIEELQRIARATAMAAGFAFAGIVTALLAILVGLVALYVWVAEHHGVYAGLGTIGGLLVLLTLGLLLAARGSARSLGKSAKPSGEPVKIERSLTVEPPPIPAAATVAARPSATSPLAEQALAAAGNGTASAADLVEPLAVLVSSLLGTPRSGNALLEPVLLDLAASGATGEVVDKATALVRDGDRATMLGVLGAAGVVGYLLGTAVSARRSPDA